MSRTLTLLLLLALSPPLNAGSFAVSPVRLTLDAQHQPVTTITVSNHSDVATLVQADALQWQASDNQDHYLPSSDLLVMPPLFTLPPHGTQIVRVGLRQRVASASERSYRVYLTEVPPPPDPAFQGLQVALRLGVPVFVGAAGTSPDLRFAIESVTAGALQMSASNSGTAHVRVNRLALSDAAGRSIATLRLARDVLAGQRWLFSVPLPAPLPAGTELRLQVLGAEGLPNYPLVMPAS